MNTIDRYPKSGYNEDWSKKVKLDNLSVVLVKPSPVVWWLQVIQCYYPTRTGLVTAPQYGFVIKQKKEHKTKSVRIPW